MRSFVELGAMLTPNPVAWLLRQSDPTTGTAVHVMGGAVIGSPAGTSTFGPEGPDPPEPPEPPVPVVAPPVPGPVVRAVVVLAPAAPPCPELAPPVPRLLRPPDPPL